MFLELSLELEKVSILGILDPVIEEGAHIQETNYNLLSITKSHNCEVSPYPSRCWHFGSSRLWNSQVASPQISTPFSRLLLQASNTMSLFLSYGSQD